MPQWRKLHTDLLESWTFVEMPDDFTRLLWVLLPLILDREGRGIAHPAWVRARLFPLRSDVSDEQVAAALDWFAARGLLVPYTVDGRSYFYLPDWYARQGDTSREAPSHYPSPPGMPGLLSAVRRPPARRGTAAQKAEKARRGREEDPASDGSKPPRENSRRRRGTASAEGDGGALGADGRGLPEAAGALGASAAHGREDSESDAPQEAEAAAVEEEADDRDALEPEEMAVAWGGEEGAEAGEDGGPWRLKRRKWKPKPEAVAALRDVLGRRLAERLLDEYPERVELQLAHYRWAQRQGIARGPGWLVEAIVQGWTPPPEVTADRPDLERLRYIGGPHSRQILW